MVRQGSGIDVSHRRLSIASACIEIFNEITIIRDNRTRRPIPCPSLLDLVARAGLRKGTGFNKARTQKIKMAAHSNGIGTIMRMSRSCRESRQKHAEH